MYVFAYGSLLDVESASRSVGRLVSAEDLVEAVLLDHRRDWRIRIPVRFEDGADMDALFLDVLASPGRYVNGACFEVSEAELAKLAAREAQYEVADVTELVCCHEVLPGPVVTFRGLAVHRRSDGDRPAVVPGRYRQWVMGLAEERGAAFAASFALTTDEADAPEYLGTYRFLDPDQAVAAQG